MDVSIYNKEWIVPAKCGSRYLDELFGTTTQYNSQFSGIEFSTPKHTQWENELSDTGFTKLAIQSESLQHYGFLPITHIVLRSPLSHLHSALHTDLWAHTGYWIPGVDNRVGIDEIEDVNPLFLETLLKYTTTGTGHYSPTLYQNVWYLLQRNRNIEVIELDRLTSLCELNGYRKVYNPNKYNWIADSSDITREELIGYIGRTYPKIWERILGLHTSDSYYYNSLNQFHTYPIIHPFVPPPPPKRSLI